MPALGWLMNLDFAGGTAAAAVAGGPWVSVEQADYSAGAIIGGAYSMGAAEAYTYSAGSVKGGVA